MSDALTTTPASSSTQAIAVVAGYVFGAIGVLLVLLLTCVVVRRVRFRSARKYIKEQSERSIPMQRPLSGKSPSGAAGDEGRTSGGGGGRPGSASQGRSRPSSGVPPGAAAAAAPGAAGKTANDRPRSRYIEVRERRLQLRQQARQQKALAKERKKEAKLGRARTAQLGHTAADLSPPTAASRRRARSSLAATGSRGGSGGIVGGSAGGGGRGAENPVYYISGSSLGYPDYPDTTLELPGELSDELADSWTSRHMVSVEVHAKSLHGAKGGIIELDAGIDDAEV